MAGRQTTITLLVPTVRVKAAGSGKKKKAAKAGRSPKTGTAATASAPDAEPAEPDEAMLNALRAWRRDEARTRAVPAYVVLHDKTIDAIAQERPRSLADLGEISGIGPAKLAAYGEAILKVLSPGS